jgi:hypothetical protein
MERYYSNITRPTAMRRAKFMKMYEEEDTNCHRPTWKCSYVIFKIFMNNVKVLKFYAYKFFIL